jgi:transposase
MIVIGVDVHKHSLTAVAVDESGRPLGELTLAGADDGLIAWSAQLGRERLWAVQDCRHVTRALERRLLTAGEQLVRVPPKLTAPERRAGRARGKSDSIDALAAARAALREPQLDRPRAGEERYRELKLLVIHRDDLVDERRRAQQRLRWHLHQLDSTLVVPAGALDRAAQLERVGRWLSRRQQSVQVRIARDLVARCRSLTRAILELEGELAAMTAQTAPALLELPGCGAVTAAKLLAEIGPIERFKPTPSSPATAASHHWKPAQAACAATASTAAATASSTARYTGSRSRRHASTRPPAPTSNANRPKARAAAKRSAASNANSPASSSTRSERTPS